MKSTYSNFSLITLFSLLKKNYASREKLISFLGFNFATTLQGEPFRTDYT